MQTGKKGGKEEEKEKEALVGDEFFFSKYLSNAMSILLNYKYSSYVYRDL